MQLAIAEDLWFDATAATERGEQAARSMLARAIQILNQHPLPTTARRLLAIAQNPDYRVREIEQVLLSDPLLSARVMRIVGSEALGLRTRCRSLQHAIVVLGGRALGELAVALAVFGLDQSRAAGRQSWLITHSGTVAVLARSLGRLLGLDELFTAGLLHDLGKLLEPQAGGSSRSGLLEAPTDPDLVHLRERETLGYDHAVLAGHILRVWQIPEPLPTVVGWHHQPERALAAGGAIAEQVALVRLADRLAYRMAGPAGSDHEEIADLLRDPGVELLELEPTRLAKAWPELRTAALASRELFGPASWI